MPHAAACAPLAARSIHTPADGATTAQILASIARAEALDLAASAEEELVLPELPQPATTTHANTRTPTRFPRIALPSRTVLDPIALLTRLPSLTPQNQRPPGQSCDDSEN